MQGHVSVLEAPIFAVRDAAKRAGLRTMSKKGHADDRFDVCLSLEETDTEPTILGDLFLLESISKVGGSKFNLHAPLYTRIGHSHTWQLRLRERSFLPRVRQFTEDLAQQTGVKMVITFDSRSA